MDRLDVRILSILQKDGQISMSRLSDRVGLSLSACHRRVKILEADGKISHYAARLNRRALGFEIQVFIEIKLNSHRREDINAFEDAIRAMGEVLECHLISGEFDYLIRVAARSTGSASSPPRLSKRERMRGTTPMKRPMIISVPTTDMSAG